VSPKRTSFFSRLAEYFQGKETAEEQSTQGSDQEEET